MPPCKGRVGWNYVDSPLKNAKFLSENSFHWDCSGVFSQVVYLGYFCFLVCSGRILSPGIGVGGVGKGKAEEGGEAKGKEERGDGANYLFQLSS